MNKWSIGSLSTAIILIIVSAVFWGYSPSLSLIQEASLSSSPDYFLIDVDIKDHDQTGKIIETIHAKEIKHYNLSSESILSYPKIQRDDGASRWQASGDSGIIMDSSRDITLTDNSEVIRNIDTPEQIRLQANIIHYNDALQTLDATGEALLQSRQGLTQATNITANIKSEQVRLNGQVRGHYEVN